MGKRASGLAQQRCNKNYVLQLVNSCCSVSSENAF